MQLWKLVAGIVLTVHRPTEMIEAERGSSRMAAISPKYSPGSVISAIFLPLLEHRHLAAD